MINENLWRKMLYVSVGLLGIVAAIIAFAVIPQVISDPSPSARPENAVPAFWVNVSFHLLAIIAIIWTIVLSIRARKINNELLVAAGIIPIILGFFLINAAVAYKNNPDMDASIWLFRCVGYDVIAGLLVLIARYFRKKTKESAKSGTPPRWRERKRSGTKRY